MATRTNSNSMKSGTSNAYSNAFGSILSKGLLKPNKDITTKKPVFDNVESNTASDLRDSMRSLKSKADLDIGKSTFSKDVSSLYKGVGGYEGIASGVTAGLGILGESKMTEGKEDAGMALKGISKGFTKGNMIGSLIPIPGAGLALGAIGAVGEGIKGATEGKKIMSERKEREKALEEHKYELGELKRKSIGRAEDMDKYQNILSQVRKNNNNKRLVTYKTGGLIKYTTLDLDEAQNYLDTLKPKPSKLKDTPIFKLRRGGSVAADKSGTNSMTNSYSKGTNKKKIILKKKGGKVASCKTGCGCTKCGKKSTPIFRRGGKMDLAKENVIVDGPSHEQGNNTGVTNDKGLPVVKNGEKVAEIESEELVMNADSSKAIDKLRVRIKSGEAGAKEELAELIHSELKNNTYDYTNKL